MIIKNRKISTLTVVITLFLAVSGFLVSLILMIYIFSEIESPGVNLSKEPPIINPEGIAAFKYYPGGGNAPDFRDGSNGPLEVKMERKGDNLVLSWDKGVGVSVVKTFDLGKVYKLNDQKLIWQIQNYDPANPQTASQSAKNQSFITPPYQLGEKPDGFFVGKDLNQNLELKKGSRVSVELLGLNEKTLPTLGVYTFDY
jgi:hypothetical protein